MRGRAALAALVALVLSIGLIPGVTPPADAARPFDLSGYLENRSAYRIAGDREVSEFRNTLQVELERAWGRWSARGVVRGRYETELEPETERELDLRELVLTHRGQTATVRLGRQQVVWGKTDGLRLLDIVNPLDLREFVLDDYVDLRIPLWMANVEWFFGEQSIQALVIPDLTFDDLADPGGEFYIAPDLPPSPLPIVVAGTRRPASRPSTWEYGLRWSGRAGPWDLTANALYGWGDDPVVFRHLDLADGAGPGGGPGTGPVVAVEPRIARRRTLGGSGDTPLGPGIFRVEATFTPDAYRDVATADGVGRPVRQKLLSYALGWDWLRSNWLISPQLFHETVIDPSGRLLGERERRYATLLLQRKLHQDRLTLRLFALHGLDNSERWISPLVSYQWLGRLELSLGADLFDGAAGGLFGQFDGKDRLVANLKYRF